MSPLDTCQMSMHARCKLNIWYYDYMMTIRSATFSSHINFLSKKTWISSCALTQKTHWEEEMARNEIWKPKTATKLDSIVKAKKFTSMPNKVCGNKLHVSLCSLGNTLYYWWKWVLYAFFLLSYFLSFFTNVHSFGITPLCLSPIIINLVL